MSRHRVHTLGRARLIAVLSALMLVFGMIRAIGFPRTALADGYGIPEVTIDANVDESGSLLVEEHRTYDFDDSFNGVYWDIPRGQYSGRDVAVMDEAHPLCWMESGLRGKPRHALQGTDRQYHRRAG